MNTPIPYRRFKEAIILLTVGGWFAFKGIILSDEYLYVEQARALAHGSFQLSPSAFSNRFGLLAPMAFFIHWLGDYPMVYVIWPFISLLLLVGVSFKILPKSWNWIFAFLLITNPVILNYSVDVSHDWVMTSFQTIAILLLFWLWQKGDIQSGFLQALTIVGCLMLAFLAKVAVIFILPFLLWLAWKVWDQEPLQNMGKQIILLGLVMIFIYLGLYYWQTGDPFYRWNGINGEHNISEWGYANADTRRLFLRATIYPLAFFIKAPGVGWPILLAGFIGIWNIRSEKTQEQQFALAYFWILLGLFWWGSSSLSSYNPMVLVDRMWLPLIPASYLVLCTYLNQQDWWRSKRFYSFTILLFLISAYAFFNIEDSFAASYQHVLIWVGLLVAVFYQNSEKSTMALILIGLQMGVSAKALMDQQPPPLLQEYEFVQSVQNQQEPSTIWADSLLIRMPGVHTNWNLPEQVELKVWDQIEFPLDGSKRHYLMLNERRRGIMDNYYGRPLPEIPVDTTHLIEEKRLLILELLPN